jgi:hypothetical protein
MSHIKTYLGKDIMSDPLDHKSVYGKDAFGNLCDTLSEVELKSL